MNNGEQQVSIFQLLNIFNAITWPIFESCVMIIWFSTFLGHYRFSQRTLIITTIVLYVINVIGNGFESPILRAVVASTLSILVLFYIGWRQRIIRNKRVLLLYTIISSLLTYWVVNFEMSMTSLITVPPAVKTSLDLLANVLAMVFAFVFSRLKYEWLTETFLERHPTQLKILLILSLFLRGLNDVLAYLFAVQHFFGSIWWDFFLLVIILAIIVVPLISNHHELLLDKINQHDSEIAATQSYTQQLESKYSEYRFFKHDYQNILSSLEYSIQVENMSDIKHTYYSVIQKSNASLPDPKMLNLKDITDVNLRSAILVKYQIAVEKQIKFNVEIDMLFQVPMLQGDFNFYRVVGILLDNAIDAAEQTADATINVLLINSEEIVIMNSCTGMVDLENVFKDGYSSKDNHNGFGLFFVKQYVDQHKNMTLTTIAEENKFIQKLILEANR